jgi:transglutaminase-like putative cysteine protease
MRSRNALAVLLVSGVAGLAIAQQARNRPTLHEDLVVPNGAQPDSRAIGGSAGGMPAAIRSGDKIIPKPPLSDPDRAPKDEPVLGAGGFAADRQTQMRPDNKTGPDSTLHYVSVFNPDVLPFKRMSAFDAAGDDYVLRVGRTALVEVPVGGTTDQVKRDYFRASVLIQLTPGKDIPLPSVAPDMRILSYETRPKIQLRFEKDGADNFYVRTDESSASGSYRLIFDCDADAGYFAPQLPAGRRYTPRMVATLTPPEIKPMMPDPIRRNAEKTLAKLDVDPDMELGAVFNKMVAYFRAFEAKTLPPTSGDLYRDLCDSQAGVCRHRAFAFAITANAIGIPTRYVENEAHAFVEVWFPERGWQRVDLGGAALRMEVTGADDKTLHRPRADDPFAKPDEYKQNYTQLQGDIAGLTKQQIDDKRKPLDQAPSSGAVGQGSGLGNGALPQDTILPDVNLPAVTMDDKKKNPKLEVTLAGTSAYRGGVIRIEGRASVDGRALADHPVDVYISPVGARGAQSKGLGRATTSADGSFRQDFTIPSSINLALYEIYLSSSPDAYYNAALSD